MTRSLTTALAATALSALVALPASAHVTVDPQESPGGFETLTFQVGHGCEGSPTERVTVQIPPGVASVKPQAKPGWELTTDEGQLSEPVDLHGETVTEGVTTVTWEGGPLPDTQMDQFRLSVYLAVPEGETVHFPVVQECEEGEHRWIHVPGEGETGDDLAEPAPSVVLLADEGGHTHESSGEAPVEAGEGSSDLSAEVTELRDQVQALEANGRGEATGGADPLAVGALVLGALGVVTGGSALAVARRR